MQSRWIRHAVSLCVLLLISAVAVGQDATAKPKRKPVPIKAPPINAKTAAKKAMEMYDADKDGKLSSEELDKCPGLKAAVDEIDPNSSGEITAEMIAQRIESWQKSKLARMWLTCKVTHNGEPLEKVTVRFVPKKFLGLDEKKWTATGKTDKNGIAAPTIPTSGKPTDPQGVGPGFYRVEITTTEDVIPAKYNTKTVLGQEVASNAKGIAEGIVFDLEY